MGFLRKIFSKPLVGGALGLLAAPFTFGTSLAAIPGASIAAQLGLDLVGGSAAKALKKDETDPAAAAAADARQAEFEASAKAGLERIALRRRRGFAASMIVDPGSSLGTPSTLGS